MRTMLALGEIQKWSVGALDVKTAFLYAELVDEEDGVYLVMPPPLLVKLGLVREGVYWKKTSPEAAMFQMQMRWMRTLTGLLWYEA